MERTNEVVKKLRESVGYLSLYMHEDIPFESALIKEGFPYETEPFGNGTLFKYKNPNNQDRYAVAFLQEYVGIEGFLGVYMAFIFDRKPRQIDVQALYELQPIEVESTLQSKFEKVCKHCGNAFHWTDVIVNETDLAKATIQKIKKYRQSECGCVA